jgi:AraC-like DNA-binding protein
LIVWPFADESVSECQQNAVDLTRAARDVAHANNDHFNLVLQLKGTGQMRHAGRDCIRRSGDISVMDSLQAYQGVFTDEVQVRVWSLPRSLLIPMCSAPGKVAGTLISGRIGVGALLRTLLLSIWSEIDSLSIDEQRGIQESLCRLTAIAVGCTRQTLESSAAACREALVHRALALIENNLAEPALNADWIATQLNISRRRLELLFEHRGIGVAGWISRRRLEECRRRLEDPTQRGLSIASIAFLAGFADLSTFNRRFRSRYGITPSDARRGIAPQD